MSSFNVILLNLCITMKKLLLMFGLIPLMASLEANAAPVSAVNIKGECEVFASENLVPEQSKIVSSCSLIRKRDFGSSMEQKMQERFERSFNVLKKQQADLENSQDQEKVRSRAYPVRFIGSASLTKRGEYIRRNEGPLTVNMRKRKTVTEKNYSAAAWSRHKALNPQIGGLEHAGDTTAEERKERRSHRPARGSATEMRRTGYLSDSIKYTELMKERDRKHNVGVRRYWKGYKQINRTKEEKEVREVKLKKLWRGDRLEGSLDSELSE
jgi:hypothetical protein